MDYSFLCVVTCGSSSSFNSRMSAESFLTKKLMQCKYELKFLIMNKVGTTVFMKIALHICILFSRASNKPRLQTSKMAVPLNWVFTLQKGIKFRFKFHTTDKEYINIRKTFHLQRFMQPWRLVCQWQYTFKSGGSQFESGLGRPLYFSDFHLQFVTHE
jgi:hypothetical protein